VSFIEVNQLVKSFAGKIVLDHLDLTIKQGECIGLIGPSGSGKSVFLKCLANIYKPDAGEIKNSLSNEDVSIMFQEGALFDSFSALDNVIFELVGGNVPFYSNTANAEIERRGIEALASVGIESALHKLPGQLSGGMRKRLSLARALINHPKLALLDDPTSGLDPIASSVIMTLIKKIHDRNGMTTIVASHDLRRLFPFVDRVVAIFDGKIVFDDVPAAMHNLSESATRNFINARYPL
jgi:phospholipid/cholesterol/gamma-HCH transport system ATP-binding protein